jgi:hypothetical protein
MGTNDDSTTPNGQLGIEDFSILWREIDDARAAKDWTLDRLAREVARLSGQASNHKTLHDRIHNSRRIPWSKAYWIVKALELDTDVWRERWERVEGHPRMGAPLIEATAPEQAKGREGNAYEQPDAADQQSTHIPVHVPLHQQSQVQAGAPTRRERVLHAILIGFAGAIIGAAATGLTIWWTIRPEVSTTESVDCAIVAVPRADVFRGLGESEPLLTKSEGERITLPHSIPEILGTDGRQYRLVRTPTRTPSGYAYMLAETLRSIPCDR